MKNSKAIVTQRNQVCMSFNDAEYKQLIQKYKAYVAKCKTKILAKAAWAKAVLLN